MLYYCLLCYTCREFADTVSDILSFSVAGFSVSHLRCCVTKLQAERCHKEAVFCIRGVLVPRGLCCAYFIIAL